MKDIFSTKAVWPSDGDTEGAKRGRRILLITFVLPAILVIGALLLLIGFQGGIEAAMANLALLLPVGYAFAAGMVASVNPCGVLMLSSYVFYQFRGEEKNTSVMSRLLRGMLFAAAITAGFVTIFAIVGGAITAGGQWLVVAFPYAGLLIGVGMVGLGVWLLATRRTIGILAGKKVAVDPKRNLGNAFLFGITYAVASLSCTLPIFLVVVGSALAGEGGLASFGQFLGYALGMGAIILVVTVGAALFRRAIARWLRHLTPYVHRLSAMFLVGAGAYLIFYWVSQAGLF
ncbi:MAG: cytochrome c biogenesis protein CcdA [Anaerolineae bacterium]|jgi:cytochrome c biogenesis protein CcdA